MNSLENYLMFLLFAIFNVWWAPKFPYPRFRWIPFVLTCLGVIGMIWRMLD